MKFNKCSICGCSFYGYGNNPYPITKGENDRCCSRCNDEVVVPQRIMEMYSSFSFKKD